MIYGNRLIPDDAIVIERNGIIFFAHPRMRFDAIFGGGGGDLPTAKAQNVTKTAARVDDVSEQAKKNKRLAASFITREWGQPRLGKPGLLGVSDRNL